MPASANARASLPPFFHNDREWKRQFTNWVHTANKGQIANAGAVTLAANTFSTSVHDARASAQSFIEFTPQTPTAATEKASGAMYVSTRENLRFVITHASKSDADRVFTYVIWG